MPATPPTSPERRGDAIRMEFGHLFLATPAHLAGVNLDKSRVMEVLRRVNDPEHPVSILDLDIVTEDDVKVSPDKVSVEFTPTVPFCPMGGAIGVIIKYALEKELGVQADVRVKAGKHVQEEALNETLADQRKYEEAKRRFLQAGLMEHCIQAG